MATPKQPKDRQFKERPNRLLSKIIASTNSRSKKDIQQWRSSLTQAENVDNPKRLLLYNIYNEILLDAHLTAEIKRRLNALLGSRFELKDEEGTSQPEATKLLQKKWFRKMTEYVWDHILWGHSLIEIESLTQDGLIGDVRLVNRWHVIPESGIVTLKQGDEKGIDFRNDKKYSPWLFEVGKRDDLGLLNKCIPHVIFKRFAQSAFSEYCEVLGVPPRVLQTDAYDTEHLDRSEDMMANMATNSYAVIGKDETIQFVDTHGGNGEIFTNLFKISGNELSKLIGGAVVGEDSKSGSRAKEQVAMDLTASTQIADKSMVEEYINENILPRLTEMGYPFQGLSFEFTREKNIKEQLDIALQISEQFEMDQQGIDYINKTFGVPIKQQKQATSFGAQANKDSKNNTDFFG